MENKYNDIFISRTMFCEECQKKGNPQKGQLFITFGGTSKKYKIHKVQSDARVKYHGITPHFVQCLGLNKKGDGIVIVSNCCIDGCGITLTWDDKKGIYNIHFKTVNARVLSIPDWEALMHRWHGWTGYTI